MYQATLVLEGGGERGVFTSGVLDCLMENDLYLSHVIGVSAGCCNGVDFVSRQPGRSRDCSIVQDKNYSFYSRPSQLKAYGLLNMDMLFQTYPTEIFPFDFDTYFASETYCEVVATNCLTGQPAYLSETKDPDRLMLICRASSSLPIVSPEVEVDGIPYVDGGISDAVPVDRAVKMGNKKIICVLTRNPGYRKKPYKSITADVYRKVLRKYPNLVRDCISHYASYNRQMEQIEKLEKQGKIFVIRPLIPTVSRLEKNVDKLMDFYQHGYQLMKEKYSELQAYLES